ncbi:hypothetical protein WA026_008104 [Henosepilachna vigintioctopunctata]|uniref:Uncharacterized protein n=1 Tax=Henosepilachna vigintioctopunctata TaxID=420089 RepID=A0AAW1TR50_9CUCU
MDRGYGIKREAHLKDRASFFSLLTFAYMLRFLYKGKKKAVEEDDLSNVMRSLKSKEISDKFEKCWKTHKPSLTKSIISCYGSPILVLWMINLFQSIIQTYSTPWALGKFVSYFEKGQTNISKEEALFYCIVLASMNITHGIWRQHFVLLKIEYGLRIQSSISSLLYRKSLVLSQKALAKINTGNILTGITKDAQTVNHVMLSGMDFIGEVIQLALVGYLLYQKVGMASAGGIGVICICMLSQIGFAKSTYQKRGACNQKSDQRLAKTEEVLSSIRLIKMYGWESFFEKQLLFLRKVELKNLYIVYILKSLARIIGTVSQKIAHISTLLICLWMGKRLNADIVYYTTNLFHKIGMAMVWIPTSIQSISECIMALKRLENILNEEESHSFTREDVDIIKPKITFSRVHLTIEDSEILNGVNLELKTGLNIVVGPSGCGKSSLLKTILREYQITKGEMNIKGTISHAMQNPWLFPSSLKQNILFGEPYDEYRYKKVLQICCLDYDVKNFNFGDELVLTDCGANLSGGQQARINLARALYKESDIYLLDDSLSSLDVNIKRQVFHKAIKNYLSNKLCILVTHNTDLLCYADNVIIMEHCKIVFSGKPCEIPIEHLRTEQIPHDNVQESDYESHIKEEKQCDGDLTNESTMLLSKSKEGFRDNIYKEIKKPGKVDLEVYSSYIRYGGGLIMIAGLCSLHIICEVSQGFAEKYLSNWLNAQTAVPSNRSALTSNFTQEYLTTEIPFNMTTDAMSTDSYFSTLPTVTKFDQSFSSNIAKITSSHLLLSVNDVAQENNMGDFYIFITSTVVTVLFSFFGAFANFYFAIKVAKNIHKSMVFNMLHGRMKFFDSHLIGNVLTRFSRDLFVVDESIPNLWQSFKMIFVSVTSLVLIGMVNPFFAGLSIIMGLIFYVISNYVISTTRNLQRLSGATLSSLIGHLNTTLDGLVTIRAHGTQQLLKDEFDKHQDLVITATHLREISTRVMSFYCHLISFIFTSFVSMRLLFVQDILAGDAGLLLTQTSMLSHYIEWTLALWMLLENSMTSVERLVEYTELPLENDNRRMEEKWPRDGEIKFRNVSLSYRSNGEIALKNLNLTIYPQEKIGVVGRTGAGKSSILVTLFKLYDFAGVIMIDNVDITTLSLRFLRTNLAIIPQDPVIFSGTLRSNIDPYNNLSDSRIWEILHIVNLQNLFQSLEENIREKNLSVGQKQLISIARALTRERKIVILDEATANMDEGMDEVIHSKIMELFKLSTVITVAHRLRTVMNSDRILVMDMGELVEFDTPQNLLNNTNGIFYKMAHKEANVSNIG